MCRECALRALAAPDQDYVPIDMKLMALKLEKLLPLLTSHVNRVHSVIESLQNLSTHEISLSSLQFLQVLHNAKLIIEV